MIKNLRLASALLLATVGCDKTCEEINLQAGDHTLSVGGWENRDFIVHIPPTFSCTSSSPVVVAFHGGGGNKETMPLLTCPDALASNPKCLDALADREGFIVVYPDGTSHPLLTSVRTFNATNREGLNLGEWACASGYACTQNVDDLSYFTSLVANVSQATNFDRKRLFVTGMSNGAAMAHRVACAFPDQIAAIAPVDGGNQAAALGVCEASAPVPVIEFHGTADPIWPYGTETTDVDPNGEGKAISVPHTITFWSELNGCDATPAEEALPDLDAADSSTVTRVTYPNCSADVVLYRIEEGGHTWPDGYQYADVPTIGVTNRDINANEVMWDFFKAHPKP